MASRVKVGTCYLFQIPQFVISRYDGAECWKCGHEFKADDWVIGKRRGSLKNKHYCIECSITLNLVTKKELREIISKEELNLPDPLMEVIHV
ncbi:MAG: hypothetical protein ACTSPB_24975 [Candidatus Thorarchaeota archaeon]